MHFILIVVLLGVSPVKPQFPNYDTQPNPEEDPIGDKDKLLKELRDTTKVLARQSMLQQWYIQERIRSDGCSGIKQVRHQRDGSKPYYTETHIGSGVASVHDHADSVATMGMGEFHVVLNGVEFRTRHNDYLLKMPSRTKKTWHELEDVPFPEVPPSVRRQPTVEGQIIEMREYFRAFKLQDASIRDYRPFFKPIISYLEGAWTYVGKEVEEPFPGERHWIEADTWEELEDYTRFTGYAGTKEALENLAFLPRSVFGISKNGAKPVLAQWNYRILCHQLRRDLPTNRLHVVDDIATRMVTLEPLHKMNETREARFKFAPTDTDTWSNGRYVGTLLDDLMEEIPGKDNYPGYLNDEAFGVPALDPVTERRLNTAYYHHLFKYNTKDGMGMQIRHRGYSDETLFMAMTSNPKVPAMTLKNCINEWEGRQGCDKYNQSWSYAFPMEIIYLTPLAKWNPYNIEFYGWASEEKAKRVTADGRDGTFENPFDGTNSKNFYRTPSDFFGEEFSVRNADTSGSDVWVLDVSGNRHKVRASGHRTFIPDIPGLGKIRQRYPIMPVHGEAQSIWKELDALKDIVLNPKKFSHMFYEQKDEEKGEEPYYAKIQMLPSTARFGGHTHDLELYQEDHDLLFDGGTVQKTSSQQSGHQHQVLLVLERLRSGHRLIMLSCDRRSICWDGHGKILQEGFTRAGEFVKDVGKTLDKPEKAPVKQAQTSNSDILLGNVILVTLITGTSFFFLLI